jgi:hypothetical protein
MGNFISITRKNDHIEDCDNDTYIKKQKDEPILFQTTSDHSEDLLVRKINVDSTINGGFQRKTKPKTKIIYRLNF